MTYKEIQRRLSKCERLCKSIKEQDLTNATVAKRQKVQSQLKTLNENIQKYKSLLLKEEKTYILTPKSGKPSAASLGDDEVEALKDADDIAAIKSADGEEIKEQEGIEFSIEETKAIAKKVGKAVAMSLKAVGDAVNSMKAIRIEENSFEIKVLYKNGSDDEFSFYIDGDTLHLQDFSFDKELVDVGVKPSGEAIVHVDHLSNELQKHFKSLNEGMYDNYKPQHFDICPGAETLRNKIIDGGKSEAELGEWTKLHDDLFKLEKAVIKANKADQKHVDAAKKLRSQIIHISRDLNIDANDISYLKSHVEKIESIASGKTINEAPYQTAYIKVATADYKKAMSILDQNLDPTYVKTDIVDDDGEGNVIIYFNFRAKDDGEFEEDVPAFIYDVAMDLKANDIPVADSSHDIDEATDINDPVLMQMRVAKKRNADLKKVDQMHARDRKDQRINGKKRLLIKQLKDKRAEIEREMENDPEIEPTGGPVADRYGDMLNKIDNAIEKAAGRIKPLDYDTAVGKVNENEPTVFDDESFDALRDIILKYVEDPDDAEKAVQQVDDQGLDSLSPELIANLERDPEFEAWYDKLHNGPSADTDYMQRRKAEKDYMEEDQFAGSDPKAGSTIQGTGFDWEKKQALMKKLAAKYGTNDPVKLQMLIDKFGLSESEIEDQGGDLDVGHQDDEPSMLKASAFETAEYAAKLVKKLAQYDKHDGEVDFPNWWQKKLILARDYMSAAFHYLDSEEKQPAIDQLALEEEVNERLRFLSPEKQKANDAKFGKRMALLKALEKGIELHKAGKISDEDLHNLKLKAGTISADSKFKKENAEMNEGTELYDRNGIHIKRFAGGQRGVMVQITIGDKYIVVPANEYPFLVRAMQSVQGDLKDMSRQYPRRKNQDEGSKQHPSKGHKGGAKKIQKAYDQVVGKMKELAKQYKAGDKSVVPQLKDLTAKKKTLEKALDKAVAGTNRGLELNELSGEQQDAIMDLQSILDDAARLGDEAREIVREKFPRMLSKGDAYGAFEFGSSANRYDTTLESIIEEIEEYYDEEEDLDEGELKEEMDGGRLFDYFKSKGYDITERRPDGYPAKEGVDGYQVSRGKGRAPQSVIFQHNKDTDEFTISRMSGYRIDQDQAAKSGMKQAGRSSVAGIDSYMTDGNYTPVGISAEGLKDIVDHVMTGLDREAKAQGDFYKDRGHTSGTIDEQFKVGDKVTYLGHPGEITKVNKEMTGAITYNVAYNKGTGRTKATNIYNKGGEIKALTENKATCCGRCGRVHVKGSGCKRPYLKGKKHCRTK